jgi:Ca2+-transporting ATPase
MTSKDDAQHLPAKPWAMECNRLVGEIRSDANCGLTGENVAERRLKFGANRLADSVPVPGWRKFIAQFADTLVLLLIIAAIISGVIWFLEDEGGLPFEALAILSIVFLNAIMGFVQQARAEEALSALREMSAPQANCIRDGERQRIAAADLVPGDIILLEEGDTVAADARLLEAVALKAAEASLTGESLAVQKEVAPLGEETVLGDRLNMVFSGTSIVGGHGRAIVTATGMQTETGRIAAMLENTSGQETPLQRELDRVGRLLGLGVLVIAVVMIGVLLILTPVHSLYELFGILIFGVALAVAAVPEGLPAIVTAVLSIGVQRMAARNAIVRKLASVETLGSANVIASDKTGTLTRNEMTVRQILTASGRIEFDGSGYIPDGAYRMEADDEADLEAEMLEALDAARCANNGVLEQQADRWVIEGDPTELALLTAARKVEPEFAPRFERVGEIPFSSERKMMTTLNREHESGHLVAFSKGAPDVLLKHCEQEIIGGEARPLTEARRLEILAANDRMAADALRTLAVASRRFPAGSIGTDDDPERGMAFLGLFGMIDPPRPEAMSAVARAREAGIRVVMITGDHPKTAAVIAAKLGIDGHHVVTGADLSKMEEAEIDRTVGIASVYARVDPAHKLAIVGALQRQGSTVAMTGDGVNDAPALKAADIGIAMGITGTDVSKGAADIILADDNFATIVAAVEEGRAIFSNIRKFLRYLLSSNVGEVMTMFFGVALSGFLGLTEAGGGVALPLLAAQILWINLVTDGAPALALGVDPASRMTMHRPPRPMGEGVITAAMWRGIVLVGLVMATGTLGMLDACLPGGLIAGTGTMDYARTMAFTTLTLFQLFNVLNARSDDRSAFDGLFSNRYLWGAIAFSISLHAIVIYLPMLQQAFSTVPLHADDWLLCAAVASSVLWLRELSKWIGRIWYRNMGRS